jgi:hypothetical protein
MEELFFEARSRAEAARDRYEGHRVLRTELEVPEALVEHWSHGSRYRWTVFEGEAVIYDWEDDPDA